MGSFIAELFVQLIFEGVFVGTGALILKALRPTRPINHDVAGLVGFLVWIFMIAAAVTIGYFLLV